MDEEEAITQFVSFTSSTPEQAAQYLRLTEGDIQQAIDLFYVNDGNDLSGSTSQSPPVAPPQTRPQGHRQRGYEDSRGIVHLDSDSEFSDDDKPEVTDPSSRRPAVSARPRPETYTPSSMTPPPGRGSTAFDDDEAMAMRLQEELYTQAGGGEAEVDPEGIRAPIGRTTETLVGPGSFDATDTEEMRLAVLAQMRARELHQQQRERRPNASSIWNHSDPSSSTRNNRNALVTRDISEASSKTNLLADLFRPPFEIISKLTWDQAREEGKDKQKWLLVNIQDPAIFDCQVLNRDIWKNAEIKATVQESFIFMQYTKNDPRGEQYINYYFQNSDNQDAYPHIAIVDPRTGEQVKVWSGTPAPKAMDFLMQLHEFLDRYSLNAMAKNPVAKRKPAATNEIPVERMTEEQMLEMALQNSLVGTEASRNVDPDELTRSVGNLNQGRAAAEETEMSIDDTELSTPFSQYTLISSSHPHSEPPSNDPDTTRIQFRHPTGRVVRRFALSDPVRRIYEWLKASPLEGKEGVEFELIFLQKNLMTVLDETIEQAGLKNGAVMVEFLED